MECPQLVFSINGGTAIAGWLRMENLIKMDEKYGTTILGFTYN